MIFLLPLVAIFGLATAGNTPTSLQLHPHDNYQLVTSSPNTLNNPVPLPPTTAMPTPPEKIAEHDQLVEELMDEKKRFDQKHLDCDETLKKIVLEIEAGIREHDHVKARKSLDDMKVYKVNDAKEPCAVKEEKVSPKTAPKDNKSDKKIDKKTEAKNGAISMFNNWTWSSMLLPLMIVLGGR